MPLNFIAKAGITAALTAANMALTMTKKIEGPRLDDLRFTGGDYGAPLAMVWGLRRMEVPIFWAEDLREVKRRRKTKGGKYNDYSYFGTWAVALAGHEIEAVRRIWFDTHLVYDLSGAGPVTPFDFGGIGQLSDLVTVYLGTEDEEVDPAIEAWCTARYGEGSAPAYRGTAKIVFKGIPLEKIGNRIPQVSVEILGSASDHFPYETIGGIGAPFLTFSADRATLLVAGLAGFSLVDVAARAVIASTAYEINDNSAGVALFEDGRVLSTDPGGFNVFAYTLSGSPSLVVESVGGGLDGTTQSVIDGGGNEQWMARRVSASGLIYNGNVIDPAESTGGTFGESCMFVDADGEVWLSGAVDATTVGFYRLTPGSGPSYIEVTGLASGGGEVPAFHYQDDTHDQFVFGWANKLYAANRADGVVVASNTSPAYPVGLTLSAFKAIATSAARFWVGFEEINSADLTSVRVLNYADWVGGSPTSIATVYDPINHALIVEIGDLRWCYLDRVAPVGVTLATICGDVAEWCGVADYDFASLDQEIPGWSSTRGPAANMIEPLLDAYDSDFRPHDFTIQGVKRAGVASGATLATAWFTGEPRFTVRVRQASELPRAILFDFADLDADQQPNTVRSDRPLDATGARGEQKIDLTTLALDPDEARQLGNRYHRRIWNERKEVSLSLTAKELKLEPGDVRTLELDGTEDQYRCTRVTIQADDQLATEWKYDHPSLAVLDGTLGAVFDGRDESVVVVPMLSKGFVLDIPLLTDADDDTVPQVYSLAAPFASGSWPGANVYQAIDGEYSDELASITSSSAATWGYVSEELPYANPNLWDRGTEITVTLQTGELTGCTEAAANANPMLNLVAIGQDGRWEIVQFTVAELTGDLTYTLSGFKRGRRGTEWAAELHAAGDVFVLLDNADPQAMGLSEVGTGVSFKAITAGRSSGFAFGYDYEGQSLKPYAPTAFTAVKLANGDWQFEWIRRTRVGGAWTSGTSIPLSEDTEAYELDLSDGTDTVTKAVTSPTYLWVVASQITDVGAEVMAGDLEAAVYQISAQVDRGFAAELTA